MNQLALLGGSPIRTTPFPAYQVIDQRDIDAVTKVLETGILSRFLGAWHKDFFGGPQIQAFEKKWAELFQANYAISVNSATSGLYAACGAAGIGPGDEVIVSPYTMSASAVAPLIFNAVPVFADIDPRTYCLSAETIEPKITKRTKAIIVVHIFGQPADMEAIMALASKHDLIVIEDAAQAPFATYKDCMVGTLGHMGVFSLNYHKHIHTGEGGVVTTNDPVLAEKLQLIRNHAESVVGAKGTTDLINMIGFNFRLGEMEAAIGLQQLSKGPQLVDERRRNVAYLESKLGHLPGLTMPYVPQHSKHVYYVHVINFNSDELGIARSTFVKALKAELPVTSMREGEGQLIGEGYVRPLYLLPLFQTQTAYGNRGCAFKCPHYDGVLNYKNGLCPNAEKAHSSVITHELMRPPMSHADLDVVVDAFHKVYENISNLRDWELNQCV